MKPVVPLKGLFEVPSESLASVLVMMDFDAPWPQPTGHMVHGNMTTFGGHLAPSGHAKTFDSLHHSNPGHPNAGGNSLAADGACFSVSISQAEAINAKPSNNYVDQQPPLPQQVSLSSPVLHSIIDNSMVVNYGLGDLDQNIHDALCLYSKAPEENLPPETQRMASPLPYGEAITENQSSIAESSNFLFTNSCHDPMLRDSDLPMPPTPTSSSVTPETYLNIQAVTANDESNVGRQKMNHNTAEKKYRTCMKDSLELLRESVPSLRAGAANASTKNWKHPGILRPPHKPKKATVSNMAAKFVFIANCS